MWKNETVPLIPGVLFLGVSAVLTWEMLTLEPKKWVPPAGPDRSAYLAERAKRQMLVYQKRKENTYIVTLEQRCREDYKRTKWALRNDRNTPNIRLVRNTSTNQWNAYHPHDRWNRSN